MARAGEEAQPPLPAPPPLRPFLRFSHLPAPALAAARRVLDDDHGFRARVAEVASEGAVGRAGWLFLARPDGWAEELAGLAAGIEQASAEADAEREERVALRRLPKVEEARRRAEAEAAAAKEEARRAGARLGDERRARREAEHAATGLRARLAAADTAHREVEDALAAAGGRVAELEAKIASLEAALATALAGAETARNEAGAALAELEARRAAAQAAPAAPAGPAPGRADLDRDALAAAVAEAAEAAGRLGAALAGAAELVRETPAAPPPGEAEPAPPSRVPPAGPARRPVPLPLGVFDDSPEAADYLLRRPGALLVVDGYNASHVLWEGLPPADQRYRLAACLAEVSARTGAEVEVVFDGAEVEGPAFVPGTGRRPVRVRFSSPGVEADDVVIARVGEVHPGRPVVVASSDRRVRDGAVRQGANVISSAQLAALIRGRR